MGHELLCLRDAVARLRHKHVGLLEATVLGGAGCHVGNGAKGRSISGSAAAGHHVGAGHHAGGCAGRVDALNRFVQGLRGHAEELGGLGTLMRGGAGGGNAHDGGALNRDCLLYDRGLLLYDRGLLHKGLLLHDEGLLDNGSRDRLAARQPPMDSTKIYGRVCCNNVRE